MLVSEIHGKCLREAETHEDSLTSAVFGHLRYVAPSLFWETLFSRAKSLPDANGKEQSLTDTIQAAGSAIETHASLTAHFWSRHPQWGEPDLILRFSGGSAPPIVILIEVKLQSFKSGVGEDDQLLRYHRILDDLAALSPSFPNDGNTNDGNNVLRYVVYLTPRESLAEVEDSVSGIDGEAFASRVFRLRWQDVLDAARQSVPFATEPARTILADVAHFLQKRGLEYFDGFGQISGLTFMKPNSGSFYKASFIERRQFNGFIKRDLLTHLSPRVGSFYASPVQPAVTLHRFRGFTRVELHSFIQVQKGKWNQ